MSTDSADHLNSIPTTDPLRKQESQRLFQKERELEAARRISEALFQHTHIDKLIQEALHTALNVVKAEAGSLLLALTDSTGTLTTQYTYEPFGNTSVAGAASASPFQYTGRENDGTGLYYYRARYYSPRLQRFVSEDPIGFGGGDVNLYAYVGNNPVLFIDPSGLTLESNLNYVWDWALGRGPRTRNYGPNDIETQEMENSVGAGKLRQFFYNKNCQDVTGYGYGTANAAWDTLLNPSTADWYSTAAQVGAWGPASATNNGNGTVIYTIQNKTGTNSAFYHSVPDRSSPTGWGSNIYQTFQWTESIPTSGRKNGGCH